MRVPSSTPAGMRTVRERCFSTRPSPRQRSHGSAIVSPTPRHEGEGRAATQKPRWAPARPPADEEALLGADLAAAVAGGAGARLRAGFGAAAVAGLALDAGVDAKL